MSGTPNTVDRSSLSSPMSEVPVGTTAGGATISYKDIYELVDLCEATSSKLLDIKSRLHKKRSEQLAWALGSCVALLAVFLVWQEFGAALTTSLRAFSTLLLLLLLSFFAVKFLFGSGEMRELRERGIIESRVLTKLLALIQENKDHVGYYAERPIERAMLEIKLERMSAAARV